METQGAEAILNHISEETHEPSKLEARARDIWSAMRMLALHIPSCIPPNRSPGQGGGGVPHNHPIHRVDEINALHLFTNECYNLAISSLAEDIFLYHY